MEFEEIVQLAVDAFQAKYNVDVNLVLTESDVKCQFYMILTEILKNKGLDSDIGVYTEISCFDDGDSLSLRPDLFIIYKSKLENNISYGGNKIVLTKDSYKGYYYCGEAFFLELKFIRKNYNNSVIKGINKDLNTINKLESINSNFKGKLIIVHKNKIEYQIVDNEEIIKIIG